MDKYIISPNPHVHAPVSTKKLMLDVIIALCPAVIVSFLYYGWSEIIIMAVSIASCLCLEWTITKFLMKSSSTIGDLSAVVTGILLAMNLPPTTPWWIVVIGAAVAIAVAKMSFGGLGQNIFNPAITGRVFLLLSFPAAMTDWTVPAGFIANNADAFTGATLLGQVNILGPAAAENSEIPSVRFYSMSCGLSGGSAHEPIVTKTVLHSLAFHAYGPEAVFGAYMVKNAAIPFDSRVCGGICPEAHSYSEIIIPICFARDGISESLAAHMHHPVLYDEVACRVGGSIHMPDSHGLGPLEEGV